MKKRLLAAIMSLCMIVSLLPVSALAAPGEGEIIAEKTAETVRSEEDTYEIAFAVQGEPVTMTTDSEADVVLVVDNSGSMDEGWFSTDRLTPAKTVSKMFANEILSGDSNNQMGVIGFADDGIAGIFVDAIRVSQKFTKNSNLIQTAINQMEADGGTNYTAALGLAYDWINERSNRSRPAYVVFISDGEPDAYYWDGWELKIGNADDEEVNGSQEAAALERAGVTIYTIGINLSGNASSYLASLATEDGGYINVNTDESYQEQLEKVLTDIAKEINTVPAGNNAKIVDTINSKYFEVVEDSLPEGMTVSTDDNGNQVVTINVGDIPEEKTEYTFQVKLKDDVKGTISKDGQEVETNNGATLTYDKPDGTDGTPISFDNPKVTVYGTKTENPAVTADKHVVTESSVTLEDGSTLSVANGDYIQLTATDGGYTATTTAESATVLYAVEVEASKAATVTVSDSGAVYKGASYADGITVAPGDSNYIINFVGEGTATLYFSVTQTVTAEGTKFDNTAVVTVDSGEPENVPSGDEVTVTKETPVGSGEEIYFFLTKPDNSTFESAEANDFYYLLHGGSATTAAAKFKDNGGTSVINTQNEAAITQYVASWPADMTFDRTTGVSASEPVGEGSTWSVTNGKVTEFTFVLDGRKYSSDPANSFDGARYAFRWAKFGWVGNDGTASGEDFHMDGMLYKVVQAQDVVTGDLSGVLKDLTENVLSFDTNGVENATEVFSFTLASCDESGNVTSGGVSIPLTATVTSGDKGGSVAINIKGDDYKTVELVPGDYIITEDLAGDQAKAWKTPDAVRFQVNTDGTVVFQNYDKTVDNSLKTYTLKYDVGNGTGNVPGDTSYYYNQIAKVTDVLPSWGENVFLGWSDGTKTYQANEPIRITKDTTLVAQWNVIPTYTLTYNANGGYFDNDPDVTTKEETDTSSERLLNQTKAYIPEHDPETPSQDAGGGESVDVLFLGWTTENNNTKIYSKGETLPDLVEETETVLVTEIQNVYAVWGYDADNSGTADVLERTVTFNAQGGTPNPAPQIVKVGDTAKAPNPAPTKDGFTFAGWTLNGEPYDFTDPVTSDIELVAQWTDATRYTVTYNANNGTLIGDPSVTVIPGRAVQLESSATRDGYIFMGWTTETILGQTYGVGASLPDMETSVTPTGDMTVYAVWSQDTDGDKVPDVNEVFIAPADITIYTGGTGYEGVSDGDGNEIENSNSGLPEPGFHIILPADLGLGDGNVLNGIVKFQYYGWDDITDNTVRREWDLSCVGVYSAELGQFVYSLVSTGDTPAVRVTYTDENDQAVEHDRIDMSANAASAKYDMSINAGGLEQNDIVAVITTADGITETRSLVIGTGELTIRSTVDRTDNTNTIADNAGEVSDGSFNAVGNNASYVVNDSEVPVPTEGDRVQLLVDQVSDSAEFNNAMGEAALDHPQVNGTAFETAYLDLVDTQNGNTVVTLNTGSMDIYWPMPSNADPSGTFQVVHYYNMNRETTVDDTALDTQASEVLTGTPEYRNGDWYVRFTTHSFSPFVLVYEEDTSRPVNPNPGGGSGGDSDSDPTGNLSIELDVNGGDDEFTFTVILTDKDGDDLENNFYYNGDYTGTIGSGDEITLEGGDKIVIRNLPEGTRYEVIIETADGYTYVIDGEEGVIHTGMNEAEFTATRTVPVADPSVTGVSRWLNTTDHIAYLTGYPGGAFGPDNNMTRAEVAQMFYALLNNKNVTITKTFPDVPADAWYAAAVNTLASLGMVSGDENGNYRPNDPITRAEFCVIALAFAYEPENAVCYFGDVSRSDWFYTYVAQAASYGWIGGYTNGNFGPNDRITRAQVTTIVNNMLGRAADRDYVIDHQADLVQFTDLTRAHWGYFQIMEATNAHDYTKSNGTENWR